MIARVLGRVYVKFQPNSFISFRVTGLWLRDVRFEAKNDISQSEACNSGTNEALGLKFCTDMPQYSSYHLLHFQFFTFFDIFWPFLTQYPSFSTSVRWQGGQIDLSMSNIVLIQTSWGLSAPSFSFFVIFCHFLAFFDPITPLYRPLCASMKQSEALLRSV